MSARLALSLLAAALVAGILAVAPASASATAEAERYFSCPQGYSFRATSDAAHCKKPDRFETRGLMPCANQLGVGLFARRDHTGNKDMCAGTNPITGEVAVERSCPIGFSKRIVRGTDQCRKRIEGEIVAPSVAVTR